MTIRTVLRSTAAKICYLAGLTEPRVRSKGLLTVVTFHRVLEEGDRRRYPYPGLAVTPTELDSMISFLCRHFDCGTLERQHERYATGETTSRPLLALTFDDAQYDNHQYARPILARHGIKATFFAPVVAIEHEEPLWHDRLGFAVLALLAGPDVGRHMLSRILADAGIPRASDGDVVQKVVQESKRLKLDERLRLVDALAEASGGNTVPEYARMMTFDELAELAAEGHEVGSHSMTHCLMPECDDRKLEYEVAESRRQLEAHLGKKVDSFCYPNGNCDARTARAVEKAGYRRAVTTRWGHNDRATDAFQLRRFDMEVAYMTDYKNIVSLPLVAFRISGLRSGS